MALLLLLTVRGHMTVVFCVGHKKLLSCDLAPPKFWMWGVLPRRVLPGRVLALANPHLLEVGSTLTSNPSTTTPPRTLTFLMWVVLPRRVLPPEPSPFGCGEYSPDECSLDECSLDECSPLDPSTFGCGSNLSAVLRDRPWLGDRP